MAQFRFKHVCIESYAVNLPKLEVTSAEIEDRLAPVYERLQIPFGTLEKLSGVHSRYFWEHSVLPSHASTIAAQSAIEGIGFPREELRAVFSCSVTRDYFEPATACLVHRNLELGENSIVMDISNACLGFSDGVMMLSSLIETGVVKAGVVVSAETMSRIIDLNIDRLLKTKDVTRDELIRVLPTFTLGSGAVAFVLCHESIATKKHRILGAASRAATEHHDLCNGNGDYCLTQGDDFNPIMHTESSKLIAAAAKLGGRTWQDASRVLGWSREDVDHIFCHQVGRQVNEAFYTEMGLDIAKEYTIYKKYGNLVSAALPSAFVLGVEEKNIKPGSNIVLTAFGSGLNSLFYGVKW